MNKAERATAVLTNRKLPRSSNEAHIFAHYFVDNLMASQCNMMSQTNLGAKIDGLLSSSSMGAYGSWRF